MNLRSPRRLAIASAAVVLLGGLTALPATGAIGSPAQSLRPIAVNKAPSSAATAGDSAAAAAPTAKRSSARTSDRRRTGGKGRILVAQKLRLPPRQLPQVPTEPEPTPETEPTSPPSTGSGEGRDPLLWPYPSDSFWNYPRGDSAALVPAGLKAPTMKSLAAEEDLLFITPDAPLVPVKTTDAAWRGDRTRCGSRTGGTTFAGLPIAARGWTTEDSYWGSRPNHSAAVVMPDYTLIETQPLHVCKDGVVVSQYASPKWRDNSILTGGTKASPGAGSHGGSYLSAFGGTIRLGEWTRGGVIPHAIKIEIDSVQYISYDQGGYRWPATRADQHAPTSYGGSNKALRMGALLTLPPSFDTESLTSEPARILARTLQRYGAYVVDSTSRDVIAYATEWGPQGRVLDEFKQEWGFPMDGLAAKASGRQKTFLQEIDLITTSLAVVSDNGPDNIGGAGARMAPFAPPLRMP